MRDRIAAFLWNNLNFLDPRAIASENSRLEQIDRLEALIRQEMERAAKEAPTKPPVANPPKPTPAPIKTPPEEPLSYEPVPFRGAETMPPPYRVWCSIAESPRTSGGHMTLDQFRDLYGFASPSEVGGFSISGSKTQ